MPDHTNRVAAVVIPKSPEKKKFLVAKRADNGNWEFPGGKEDLEKDSNILETAEREILEELKIEVKAFEHREEFSYKGGGYDIIPVLAEHSYSNPDSQIELEDHTEYRCINPEKTEIDLEKEIKCLEAFSIV